MKPDANQLRQGLEDAQSAIEIDTAAIVGWELQKAKDLFGLSGWLVRCVSADGKERFVTQDVMPTRINVETVGGVITKVRSIG